MLIGDNSAEIEEWRSSMHQYEKSKRTKKPFGRQFKPEKSYVTEAEIKKKDQIFHPVLQAYTSPIDDFHANAKEQSKRKHSLMKHIQNTKKYDRSFDIINLHGENQTQQQKLLKNKAPVRNLYNPINNRPLPEFHFQGRDVRLPINHEFKSLNKKTRDYNIVSGEFFDNNENKIQQEMFEQNRKAQEKYNKSHVYDKVFGRYYDPHQQQEHEKIMAESQFIQDPNYSKRFPPSYVNREPFIADPTKPLPETVKSIDEKRQNAKKRYKLKYIVEDDYAKRNYEDQLKKQVVAKNRIHNSHVMELKAKEFDIVNLKRYESSRAQKLLGKQAVNSTWDRLVENDSKNLPIKSAGFG